MIEHLRTGVYCRVKPSPLHGVGVFAIRDIPKGTELFIIPRRVEVITKAQLDSMPPGVSDLVKDFGCEVQGDAHLYAIDLHAPPLCLFINHSESPNCEFVSDGVEDWTETLRDIKAGEELFRDYRTDDGADYILRGGEKA